MPNAKHSRGSVVIHEEATPYVVSAGPGLALPMVTNSISATDDLIESRVVHPSRSPREPHHEAESIGGGVTIQPDPIGIGYLLKAGLGAPVTTGAGPYVHTFKISAAALQTLTVDRIFADIGQIWRGIGLKVNRFSFDATPRGLFEMPFEFVGVSESLQTVVLDAAPYAAPDVAFRNAAITMSEAGVSYAKATRFALTFDNEIEAVPTLNNAGAAGDLMEGMGRPTGTFTSLISDGAQYTKAKNGTKTSFNITFPATDGTSSLAFTLAEVKLRLISPGVSSNRGPVVVDYGFVGFHATDAGASALTVVLTNSHASYASIPA